LRPLVDRDVVIAVVVGKLHRRTSKFGYRLEPALT
jgi:hypothetical protein